MRLAGTALLACSMAVTLCTPARADTPDHAVYDNESQGWNGAGTVCDFSLYAESSSTTLAIQFHGRRPGGTQGIFHIEEHGLFRNERTGATLTYDARWTESGSATRFQLRGGFLRLHDGDGRLVWNAAGSAVIAEVHDAYVFARRTPHATVVPGFTEVPATTLCALLGGHAA